VSQQDEESGEGISRRRIQSLSDLIFGLALSISALVLVGHQPSNDQQFFFSLALYGFSFLILMGVWRAYSRSTSVLPVETSGIIQLNVVLLFCVSVVPYLFNELFATSGELAQAVSSTFAVDLSAMFFILGSFTNTVAKEEKQLVPRSSLARYKFERNRNLFMGLLFAASILPFFGETTVVSITSGSTTSNITFRHIIWFVGLAISYASNLFVPSIKTSGVAEPKPGPIPRIGNGATGLE